MISDRKQTVLLVALLVLTPVFLTASFLGSTGSSAVPAVATYNDADAAIPVGRAHTSPRLLALRNDGTR